MRYEMEKRYVLRREELIAGDCVENKWSEKVLAKAVLGV